jgi:hypothetical protein
MIQYSYKNVTKLKYIYTTKKEGRLKRYHIYDIRKKGLQIDTFTDMHNPILDIPIKTHTK